MNEVNELLRRALALGAEGSIKEALALLELGIATARGKGDREGAGTLLRHAGAIASGSGDFDAALGFYADALRLASDDPWLHIAYAGCLRRLGKLADARAAYERAQEEAAARGDAEVQVMAEKGLRECGS